MYVSSDRLKFPCYRCYRCHRVITKLQIVARWEEAEKDLTSTHLTICPCGSRHINPTNPSLFEELTTPAIWKLWYYEVFLPWLYKKLGK